MFDLLNEIGKIPTNSLLQTYLDRQSAMFDSASAMKSVVANIKRGEKAMTKALLDKTSVHRAMYLQGNDDFNGGWVDFVWGADWLVKQTQDGKGKPKVKKTTGMGIYHIIDGRVRKDNMTLDEVMYFLTKRIPQAIAKGRLDDYKSTDNVEMVKIYHKKDMVQVKRTKGNNAWIITAFELWE